MLNNEQLKKAVEILLINPKTFNKNEANSIVFKLKEKYYNGTPVIPDQDYDRLEASLKVIWPDLSALNFVGYKVEKQQAVKLPYILGSLNKVYETDISWLKGKKDLIVSEKLDGQSAYVEYENGEVIFAATRGDSRSGYDITNKAKIFCPKIPIKERIGFRGELTMVGDSYKEHGYKNRRNGVVGLVKNETYTVEEVKDIVPKFYEIIHSPFDLKTELDRFEKIKELGLPMPVWNRIQMSDKHPVGSLISYLNNYLEKKNSLPYDIDGMVICETESEREDVEYPKKKIAFKKNAEGTKTTVDRVEWNVSRTGRLVPLVWIEPVDVQGITVNKASGFNAEFIQKNNVCKGSVISIVRAGDVIPDITEIISSNGTAQIPTQCPSCGKSVKLDGVDLVCENEECSTQNEKKLLYFLSVMGVEEMAGPTVRKLGWKNIKDVYTTKIAKMEGIGDKKLSTIEEQVAKTLNTNPVQLLASFGISNCAIKTCEMILDNVEKLEDVFSLTTEDLVKINGIGEIVAKYFVTEIKNWKSTYEFLLSIGMKIKAEEKGDKLKGKSFCFTGKLNNIKRPEAEKLVKKLGGEISSVNKTLTYLVTNDTGSGSSKNKKAAELGVQVITEQQFLDMVK